MATASPLKKQMLLFDLPESPQKNVADLGKPLATQPEIERNIFGSSLANLKPTNLLK